MSNPFHHTQFGKPAYVQPVRYTIQTGEGLAEGKSDTTRNALALVVSATSAMNVTAYNSALIVLQALTDDEGKVTIDKRDDVIALYWNDIDRVASLKAGKAVYNPSEYIKVYEASRDEVVTHCNSIKLAFEACNRWNPEKDDNGKVIGWEEILGGGYIPTDFGFFPQVVKLDLSVGNDEATSKKGKTSGRTIVKE